MEDGKRGKADNALSKPTMYAGAGRGGESGRKGKRHSFRHYDYDYDYIAGAIIALVPGKTLGARTQTVSERERERVAS